jgi:hypothetical protein
MTIKENIKLVTFTTGTQRKDSWSVGQRSREVNGGDTDRQKDSIPFRVIKAEGQGIYGESVSPDSP